MVQRRETARPRLSAEQSYAEERRNSTSTGLRHRRISDFLILAIAVN